MYSILEIYRGYSLFAMTLLPKVSNDAAVIVYHKQMLSDIPKLSIRSHITIERGHVNVKAIKTTQNGKKSQEYQPTARETMRTVS